MYERIYTIKSLEGSVLRWQDLKRQLTEIDDPKVLLAKQECMRVTYQKLRRKFEVCYLSGYSAEEMKTFIQLYQEVLDAE